MSGTAPNLTYTPAAGYSGPDRLTFRVTDAPGAVSNTATVSITVQAPAGPAPASLRVSPTSVRRGRRVRVTLRLTGALPRPATLSVAA